MKPTLRLVSDDERSGKLRVDPGDGNPGGHSLPPEMVGRPDAAELRAFMMNFQRIGNADDRRMILDTVRQAAERDT